MSLAQNSRVARYIQRDNAAREEDMTTPPGSALIPLSKGQSALVDAADFEWLSQWKWSLHGQGYASRQTGGRSKRTTIMMHRLIAGTADGMDTDHINGNKLDNRRANLRQATRGQNNVNRGLAASNSTGYRGVQAPVETGSGRRWKASITVDNRNVALGSFRTPEDAALAVDNAAKAAFGEFARLNFPDQIGTPTPRVMRRSAGEQLPAPDTQARQVYDCIQTTSAPMTVQELSEATSISAANVYKYVERLLRFGFVSRLADVRPHRYFVQTDPSEAGPT